MTKVKKGSTVTVHYTGTLEDGAVFDSSIERDALTFVVGEGDLIPGFEKAVIGLAAGDKTSVTLEPDQAYGQYDEKMVVTVDKAEIPDGVEAGMMLQAMIDERPVLFTVTEISDDAVTLDGNHPLAGKSLCFDISVVAVA